VAAPVMLKCACPLPSVRDMVLGPHPMFIAVGDGGGPRRGLCPPLRPTLEPPGRARWNPFQGVGRDGPHVPRVRLGGASPQGSNMTRPIPKGPGKVGPMSLGLVEVGLFLTLVRTEFHTEGSTRFVITFLIYRKASS
jgi:hypothetical protein